MDWRDNVMADVGRGMGVEGLNFSDNNVIRFEFEQRGDLYIESREDGVLFYLTRSIQHQNCLDVFKQALKRCHYSQNIRFPLQVGLQGEDGLFLCSFLENESFSRPNIEGVIEMIGKQFDRLEGF